jgi:hypothetical protein
MVIDSHCTYTQAIEQLDETEITSLPHVLGQFDVCRVRLPQW